MSDLLTRLLAELEPEFRTIGEKAAADGLAAGKLVRIVPDRTLAVSVTGTACRQKCAHCNGHYLQGMIPLERLSQMDLSQFDSVLLSGGGLTDGEVQLAGHAQQILELPQHLSLNLHPGFQSPEKLAFLKDRKVIISFDLPASQRVISEVFRLPYSIADYQKLYLEFSQKFATVPHLNLGLDHPDCLAENSVIDFLAQNQPQQLVFIVFRPTPGTPLAENTPPDPGKAVQLIADAKKRLNSTIKIGCMRPSGTYRRNFDILAWLHGIEHFVQVDRTLLKILGEFDLEIQQKQQCCAL